MVLQRDNESGMQDNDKKAGSKFFYAKKKQKSDPWSSFDKDFTDDSKKIIEKANYGSLNAKSSKASELNSLSFNSNFDLESVWSVRKNVPLPSSKKQGNQVNLQTGNSYYSRHAGGFTGSQHNKAEEQASKNESGSSSWQLKKSGFSYARQSSLKRQADSNDDDEFDFGDTKRKGNVRSNGSPSNQMLQTSYQKSSTTTQGSLAGLVNPVRKESARTQRAHKMHEAYLRSAGLGSYSQAGQFHSNIDDGIG
ncbi:uncharacterized protein LOC135685187 [Rhopilema esculentum]|uniref:uncharacterized protein LOC135685187 n=1 Tax=Rhopilema esculentum TaxID=499914 RepID=UPI0031D7E81F